MNFSDRFVVCRRLGKGRDEIFLRLWGEGGGWYKEGIRGSATSEVLKKTIDMK